MAYSPAPATMPHAIHGELPYCMHARGDAAMLRAGFTAKPF